MAEQQLDLFGHAAVGDVTSDERGSGARYNASKPRLELIPVRALLDVWLASEEALTTELAESLAALANFQERTGYVEAAIAPVVSHLPDAAAVLDYGAKKYAEWNWAKGMKWSVCFGCALRHASAILDGEVLDAESGLPHVGHYLCNLIFLLHYTRNYTEGDDRPPPNVWSHYMEGHYQ